MDNMPILRLELDYARERMTQAWMVHQDALNEMVADSLRRELSVDNVKNRVDRAVMSAIDEAIKDISANTTIKRLVRDIVLDALEDYNRKVANIKNTGV